MKSARRTSAPHAVPPARQVLVAIMNNRRDFAIARDQHWYRIPVRSAPRAIVAAKLALYQTKVFGAEKWAINYWADVKGRSIVKRHELLPAEAHHARANDDYYKLELGALQQLPRSIISRAGRRIVFIPTTLSKFQNALEINDLFHESPLEDQLWNAFKEHRIEAERQYYLNVRRTVYCLDFAVFCGNGQIDIECDGDSWHAQVDRIAADNKRDNDLTSKGWAILRFNTRSLHDEMPDCMQRVRETINQNGGLVSWTGETRWSSSGAPGSEQRTLFAPPR